MQERTPEEHGLIGAMAEALAVGVLVVRAPSGDVVYVNRALLEMVGLARAELSKGYGFFTREGAPYPHERLPFVDAMRRKAPVARDDLAIHRRDGGRLLVRASAQPFGPADEPSHVVTTFVDIGEEVEARRRADLVEQRLDHLLSRAPLILFAFDAEGVITLSEGSGLAALGYRPRELLGRSVFEIYGHDHESATNARRALAGEAFTVTATVGPISLETTFTPIRDAKGALAGSLGLCLDATERVNMQARLVQAERLASMGTLSAAVAHEINNPLAYVIGNLESVHAELAGELLGTAERGLVDTPELVRRMGEALEGAGRVRRIVRGLRTFSRQDEDRAEPTDVRAAIEHAVRMTENVVRHRARLVQRLGDVPAVFANDLRLSQVFVNLLLNAAQAIPEGHADTQEIRVLSSFDAKRGVIVTIEDTGVGIAPETKARLFEPFFTTKPVGEGTGLGLSVCYGILKGFGAAIEVDSAPGRGASVRVTLAPYEAARVDAGAGGSGQAAPLAPARRGRILIVDDDDKVAKILALTLEGEHDVDVVVDSRAAAERILAGARFDVILCDLMMPQMTGMELYALFAARVPDQAERMVFITGGAFTPAAHEFTTRVPNPFLEKPFDERALRAVLAGLLRA